MSPIIFNIFGNSSLIISISKMLDFKVGNIIVRDFPDKETYIKIDEIVQGKDIVMIDSLDRPNEKILPLLFIANTAREMGARQIGLVSPYLAYMRQDTRFNPGEAITSRYFGKLISSHFDWLLTVDPHLHRHKNLNEIYAIQASVIQSGSEISKWILKNVERPVLIGPDVESEQWVSGIAKGCNAPYVILKKIRKSDREVEISMPDMNNYISYVPVLMDDIISTGHTMIETINHLKKEKMREPVCIGVHAIFADNSYEKLKNLGVKKIVTCNTIYHPSNEIDLSTSISSGVKKQLAMKNN